jgi:hypothetical protein
MLIIYHVTKYKLMKNIVLILIISLSISCKAQIVPLGIGGLEKFNGAYNKDMDNDYNKFEGVWVYYQNNTKLTIQLKKVYQYHYQDERFNYYSDVLVGEYKYEENNVTLVNTLPNMTTISDANAWQHNIFGGAMNNSNAPINNGAASERTVVLELQDPDRPYIPADIRLKYKIENGVEKITIHISPSGAFIEPYENAPSRLRIPNADYTLIKQ